MLSEAVKINLKLDKANKNSFKAGAYYHIGSCSKSIVLIAIAKNPTLPFILYNFHRCREILNLPALLQKKNTRVGPFRWKRSVLQNPDRERTNQSTGICLRLDLPVNTNITESNRSWPLTLMFIQFDWISLVPGAYLCLTSLSAMRAITKKNHQRLRITRHCVKERRKNSCSAHSIPLSSLLIRWTWNTLTLPPSPNIANRVFQGDQWLSTIWGRRTKVPRSNWLRVFAKSLFKIQILTISYSLQESLWVFYIGTWFLCCIFCNTGNK